MLYLVMLAVVVGYLVLEQTLHRRRLQEIPLRIHVNGTRGKTTVTRLAAELLRRTGIRTLAKTTGDHPELILPDGRRARIRRRSSARIHEQLAFIAEAARQKAQAVVIECMALDERLQDVSERRMVQSTIGVLTNIRPDHFEAMGSSLAQVAQSLSRTIPSHAVLITMDGPFEPLLRQRCAAAGTRVCLADPDCAGLGKRTSPSVAEENLAFVRAIGLEAGLARETVDGIISEIAIREGAPALLRMGSGPRCMALVDAFSANDIISAARVQEELLASDPADLPRPVIALLNTRADRPLRTIAFAEYIATQTCFDAIGLTGDGRRLARRRLRRLAAPVPLITLAQRAPAQMLAVLARWAGSSSFTLVGLGNHRGAGEALRRFFVGEDASCC